MRKQRGRRLPSTLADAIAQSKVAVLQARASGREVTSFAPSNVLAAPPVMPTAVPAPDSTEVTTTSSFADRSLVLEAPEAAALAPGLRPTRQRGGPPTKPRFQSLHEAARTASASRDTARQAVAAAQTSTAWVGDVISRTCVPHLGLLHRRPGGRFEIRATDASDTSLMPVAVQRTYEDSGSATGAMVSRAGVVGAVAFPNPTIFQARARAAADVRMSHTWSLRYRKLAAQGVAGGWDDGSNAAAPPFSSGGPAWGDGGAPDRPSSPSNTRAGAGRGDEDEDAVAPEREAQTIREAVDVLGMRYRPVQDGSKRHHMISPLVGSGPGDGRGAEAAQWGEEDEHAIACYERSLHDRQAAAGGTGADGPSGGRKDAVVAAGAAAALRAFQESRATGSVALRAGVGQDEADESWRGVWGAVRPQSARLVAQRPASSPSKPARRHHQMAASPRRVFEQSPHRFRERPARTAPAGPGRPARPHTARSRSLHPAPAMAWTSGAIACPRSDSVAVSEAARPQSAAPVRRRSPRAGLGAAVCKAGGTGSKPGLGAPEGKRRGDGSQRFAGRPAAVVLLLETSEEAAVAEALARAEERQRKMRADTPRSLLQLGLARAGMETAGAEAAGPGKAAGKASAAARQQRVATARVNESLRRVTACSDSFWAVSGRAERKATRDNSVMAAERAVRRRARLEALDRPMGSVPALDMEAVRLEASVRRLVGLEWTLGVVEQMRVVLMHEKPELSAADRALLRLLLRLVRRGVALNVETSAQLRLELEEELAHDPDVAASGDHGIESLQPALDVLAQAVA